MKMQEIRDLAKARSINPGKLSKTELIRKIQREEGNFDCYSTAGGNECDQIACLWRNDCFESAAAH